MKRASSVTRLRSNNKLGHTAGTTPAIGKQTAKRSHKWETFK